MEPEQVSNPVGTTWEQMSGEQLKVYAKEVAGLYQQERKLRHQLEAKNKELEQRVKELSALNSMFQQHLKMRLRTEEAFKKLADRIASMAEEARDLKKKLDSAQPT